LEIELNEQVLLNGKGSEREAALLAKVERLERENAALTQKNSEKKIVSIRCFFNSVFSIHLYLKTSCEKKRPCENIEAMKACVIKNYRRHSAKYLSTGPKQNTDSH
ncbi:MAG: hypothetical protein ACK55I_00190, partial [bacterium]